MFFRMLINDSVFKVRVLVYNFQSYFALNIKMPFLASKGQRALLNHKINV